MSQQLDELDAKIAAEEKRLEELQNRRDRKLAIENQQARKWRTRALVIFGGEILRAANLDWDEIDPEKLRDVLSRNGEKMHNWIRWDEEKKPASKKKAIDAVNDFKRHCH